ncbi:ADP-ribose pyrophosphatase mitochondrial [Biomphalaria glabrata]|nr:ADP-ribose pyrophosphatase; mitochondrial-like [Biomphalaria glabrata]
MTHRNLKLLNLLSISKNKNFVHCLPLKTCKPIHTRTAKLTGLILCCNLWTTCASLLSAPLVSNKSFFLELTSPNRSMCAAVNSPSHCSNNLHVKCRNDTYPRSKVVRTKVPDDKVDWSVNFPEYAPVVYTSDSVKKKPEWADDDYTEPNFSAKWNEIDGNVDRRSFLGKYDLTTEGIPINPKGRTGIKGRGCLGRWGPNHAADPIVTRWKMEDDKPVLKNGKRVAQFISVQRKDNGQWALPGGMVDPGEEVTETVRREFGEEALDSMNLSGAEKEKMEAVIDEFFHNGTVIYKGYVDDPRNTDNAWMETVAMNFHDDKGTGVAKFSLNAGSDAIGVQWLDISKTLELYASHADFIRRTAQHLDAYWE